MSSTRGPWPRAFLNWLRLLSPEGQPALQCGTLRPQRGASPAKIPRTVIAATVAACTVLMCRHRRLAARRRERPRKPLLPSSSPCVPVETPSQAAAAATTGASAAVDGAVGAVAAAAASRAARAATTSGSGGRPRGQPREKRRPGRGWGGGHPQRRAGRCRRGRGGRHGGRRRHRPCGHDGGLMGGGGAAIRRDGGGWFARHRVRDQSRQDGFAVAPEESK